MYLFSFKYLNEVTLIITFRYLCSLIIIYTKFIYIGRSNKTLKKASDNL